MKRFSWVCIFAAILAQGQAGGPSSSSVRTQNFIPSCIVTSGSCPSNGYTCASGTTLYRCTSSGGWATVGDGTGTGFASDPSACSANQFVNDIGQTGTLTCAQPAFSDLSGSATDAQIPDGITVTLAATATTLAADPADCSSNQFANAIAESGALTCSALVDADIPDTITVNSATAALGVVNSASPTVGTAGYLGTDTTEDQFLYYSTALRVLPYKQSIGFTLETPSDADNFLIWKAPYDITITAINCIVDPADTSESAVVTVQERDTSGDNPSGIDGATTITCGNSGAADDGTLSNPTVTTGEWLGIDIGTVTGTVTQLAVTITFTVDRK